MSTESRRIQRIVSLVAASPAAALAGFEASVGLGALDDCAVIPFGGDVDLVFGTDFVRGTGFHLFRLGHLSLRDIGHYLVGANLSDLAAMGATPVGIAVVVRYTSAMTDDEFAEIMEGITSACARFGAPLLGGDTGSYELPVLSASAIGAVARGKALRRAGGRPGDILFLAGGDVGTAGAAIAYFTRAVPAGLRVGAELEEAMLRAWRRVQPCLQEGMLLVREGFSACAIDTSDGLKAACRQLAEASKLAAVVRGEQVPVSPAARAVADLLGVDPLALAIGDSVDFRLVFSTPKAAADATRHAFRDNGWSLVEIGTLQPSDRHGAFLADADGRAERELPGVEWSQSDQMAIDELLKSGGK